MKGEMKKYKCEVFGYVYYINAETEDEAKREACIRCDSESSVSLYFPALKGDVEVTLVHDKIRV